MDKTLTAEIEKPPLEIVLKVANRATNRIMTMRLARTQAACLAEELIAVLRDTGPDSTGVYTIEVG